jgi:putative transposase
MADAYSKIQIHIVFAVKFRLALISSRWEEELYKYITGIIQNHGHKLLAINGMPDHIHILIGFKPVEDLSSLIREIKKASTEWIKTKQLTTYKFQWQEGYGAFSYAQSDIKKVANYIINQKQHHAQAPGFRDEYIRLLKEFDVDFDEKYILQNPE